jgi:hypothetical protein
MVAGATMTRRRERLAAVRARRPFWREGGLVVGSLDDEVVPNVSSGLAATDAVVC